MKETAVKDFRVGKSGEFSSSYVCFKIVELLIVNCIYNYVILAEFENPVVENFALYCVGDN